jgi:hypothetical protein
VLRSLHSCKSEISEYAFFYVTVDSLTSISVSRVFSFVGHSILQYSGDNIFWVLVSFNKQNPTSVTFYPKSSDKHLIISLLRASCKIQNPSPEDTNPEIGSCIVCRNVWKPSKFYPAYSPKPKSYSWFYLWRRSLETAVLFSLSYSRRNILFCLI